MNNLRLLKNWYVKKLDTNPIMSRCFTAGAISLLGDSLCQKIEKSFKYYLRFFPIILRFLDDKTKKFDYKRTATFTSVGFFYVAPMLYMNYSFILPTLVPATARYATIKKVAIDQTAFASAMTCGFFVIINLMEGNTV